MFLVSNSIFDTSGSAVERYEINFRRHGGSEIWKTSASKPVAIFNGILVAERQRIKVSKRTLHAEQAIQRYSRYQYMN